MSQEGENIKGNKVKQEWIQVTYGLLDISYTPQEIATLAGCSVHAVYRVQGVGHDENGTSQHNQIAHVMQNTMTVMVDLLPVTFC